VELEFIGRDHAPHMVAQMHPSTRKFLIAGATRNSLDVRATAELLHLLTAAIDAVNGACSRHRSAIGGVVEDEPITLIGVDIAKNVFQVHGIGANENVPDKQTGYAVFVWAVLRGLSATLTPRVK
jgi:hypothetical protein